MNRILKSYFYWTYPRGSFHYDVMVSLILLFIFATPFLWNYGDKPSVLQFPRHPMTVTGDEGRGMVISLQASDLNIDPNAPDADVKKLLRTAIEPVAGDSVVVERWNLLRDAKGNPQAWQVWAHR